MGDRHQGADREDRFAFDPREIAAAATSIGFAELPVSAQDAAAVRDLPMHHRDPFDRLLLAQAIMAPARLYTRDAKLQQYSELVVLV